MRQSATVSAAAYGGSVLGFRVLLVCFFSRLRSDGEARHFLLVPNGRVDAQA